MKTLKFSSENAWSIEDTSEDTSLKSRIASLNLSNLASGEDAEKWQTDMVNQSIGEMWKPGLIR